MREMPKVAPDRSASGGSSFASMRAIQVRGEGGSAMEVETFTLMWEKAHMAQNRDLRNFFFLHVEIDQSDAQHPYSITAPKLSLRCRCRWPLAAKIIRI